MRMSRAARIWLPIVLCGATCMMLGGCAGNSARLADSDARSMNGSDSRETTGLFELQRQADEAYEQGRLLDAEQLYRRMLAASPASGYAWMRLGNVQLRNDQLEAAIHAYRQCLRFETGESRCWQNLSLTYVEMAVATLDQADGKISDEPAKVRMAAFKRRLIESVNVESTTAR